MSCVALILMAASLSSLHPSCTNCHLHHQHSPPPDSEAFLSGPRTVPYLAHTPLTGVKIAENKLLLQTMEANIDYLLTSFEVDHMLLSFRVRAGIDNATTGSRAQIPFWDSDLKGSNAGRFLMGAGTKCARYLSLYIQYNII